MARLFVFLFISMAPYAALAAPVFTDHPFFLFGLGENLTADIALADADGDGDLDVFVANGRHWAQQDFLYLNLGNGKLPEAIALGSRQKTTYTVIPFKGAQGEMQAVAVHDYLPPSLLSLSSSLNQQSEQLLSDKSMRARGAVHCDITSDGLSDIIVVSRVGKVHLYPGAEDGFLPVRVIDNLANATGIACDDVDQDGDNDLILARRDEQSSLVAINQGQATFTTRSLPDSIGDTRSVITTDINQDGHKDIVLGLIGSPNRIYSGDGKGHFTFSREFGDKAGRTYALAAGDIDGDGTIDIAEANDGQVNKVYFFRPQSIDVSAIGGEALETYGIALGDMNGDGYLDVVVANSGAMNAVFINKHEDSQDADTKKAP